MTQNDDNKSSNPSDTRLKKILYFSRLFFSAVICSILFAAYVESQPLPKFAVPVLTYHMVATYTDDSSYTYNVPPAEFRRQLEWLKANGYTTVSLLDIMKAKKGKFVMPEKPIVLTFDDGYDNNYFELLPILREYDMKATVFMITNKIGEEGYLSWDDLRTMQNNGIEIGSHTANHLPVTDFNGNIDKYDEEILLSKLLLEWNGIRTVFFLSYPNGKFDDNVVKYLKESEFLGAVTGKNGFFDAEKDDVYLIPRINIPHPRFGEWELRWRIFKAEFMTKLRNVRI